MKLPGWDACMPTIAVAVSLICYIGIRAWLSKQLFCIMKIVWRGMAEIVITVGFK